MLQSLLPCKPVMWNNLITGADRILTKFPLLQQSSFLSPSMLSGRESMTGRDDVESEPFTMGSADLGFLMADRCTEEEIRILSTACYFTPDDTEGPEEGMLLFGGVNESIKTDYNWDQCFGNLQDVDNLLSSGPDVTFGPTTAGSAVDSMQWHDSNSPPAVQPENATLARSPLRSECGATAKGNLGDANLRMEFVPGEARLAQPNLEKPQLGVKTADDMPATERWSSPESGAQFMASDCLQDVEAMAGGVPLAKMNGDTSVSMYMSGDGAGASSVSHSDSEKASMAQAQRAWRHAANRKKIEERSKRQQNHRKFAHGSAYTNAHVQTPHFLPPIPLHSSTHANYFNQPLRTALYGFAAPHSNLASMQALMRPAPPYMHGRDTPICHIQPVPPNPVSSEMQQGLFLGYRQPSYFQPTVASQHQQFRLRPPLDAPICPPLSSSSMTPQEKIEKLKYLQQMQAWLAVEHQQHQFVAQGVVPVDSIPSPNVDNVPAQLPQIIPVRPSDLPVTVSEMKMSALERGLEPSLSVGQISLETTSEDEAGSMEAAVLDQLQSTMKLLEVETKLCIRDSLYRLARSAMRRKGSGGRGGGQESGNNAKASEDGEGASDGLESSINSYPCSSSRVSRMNMDMVETETNPIDRSIAHLLFYKPQQEQALAQPAPSILPTQLLGIPDAQTSLHQGDLPQNNWRPCASLALPVTGSDQGVEIGAPSAICPFMTLVIPATLRGRFQAAPGIVSPLIADCQQQLQSTSLGTGMQNEKLPSPMGLHLQCQPRPNVGEQRPLQAQVASHKVSPDCRNGIRNTKRLEHALGLKELSHLLIDGLDVDSGALRRDEALESPISNSGVHEEGQGGNHERSKSSRPYPFQKGIIRQREAMRSC